MTTILAPHVDDELIGCFTRLQNRSIDHVIYFFELTPERKKEAKAAAEHFGFIPIFARPDSMKLVMDTVKDNTVLLPACTDSHPDHKYINRRFRNKFKRIEFYSVDLGTCLQEKKTLEFVPENPYCDTQRKRDLLNTLYPSQSELWKRDSSYWLFESIVGCDYSTLYRYNIGRISVESSVYIEELRRKFSLASFSLANLESPDSVMNALISIHPGPHQVSFLGKVLSTRG